MRSLKQVLCEHDYKFDKGYLVCVKCDDVMHQMVADLIIKEARRGLK